MSGVNRLMTVLAAAALLLGFLIFFAAGYLIWLDRPHPVTFANQPYKTEKASYVTGENVRATVTGCLGKYPVAAVIGRFTGVEGTPEGSYTLPPKMTVAVDGPYACVSRLSLAFAIGPDIPTGRYTLDVTVSTKVNPFGRRTTSWHTVPFQVTQTHP